ncbi:MAG: hypothetical protein DRQ04_00740 [Candidatus Hydrothermota bacterium]|nr:MAG: hypothetical protein DRQ04_00740 [Candidatus Hydrothermae bacterium]
MEGGRRDKGLNPIHKVLLLSLFAVSMAYVEASVVIYLREILYGGGKVPLFPLRPFKGQLLLIEMGREASTLLMLLSVGFISFRSLKGRAAAFFYTFGLWDIFYYIWLKILVGWPLYWGEYDLLFLIPLPWIAPFIAPVFIALFFSASSLYVMLRDPPIDFRYLFLALAGGFLDFLSFIYIGIAQGGSEKIPEEPGSFPWAIYIAGLLMMVAGFYLALARSSPGEITENGDTPEKGNQEIGAI